ncbi:MAG TPA: WD40 repeat domain-containing serine/threonine-protein kinase, partial [Chroococcidiopsis sp.]
MTVPNFQAMSQPATEPIALCFNPTCPHPQNVLGAETCTSCGAGLQLQARYTAVRVLAGGRLGRTLLAVDQTQTPMVPCVIQQRWLTDRPSALAAGASWWPQAEVQRLNSLATHAQWPTILDRFDDQGIFYLVQQYIPGDNLAIALSQRGTFSPAEIWLILGSLLSILGDIHGCGLIHGDIKPENIIVQGYPITDKALFLVDFGDVRWVTPTSSIWPEPLLAKTGGSPEYAAPEQLAGQAVFASDLYSLGVTCLHLLTGLPPLSLFDSATHQWIWRDYWPSSQKPECAALADFLDRLIAPGLSDRFDSAAIAIAHLPRAHRPKRFPVSLSSPAPLPVLSPTVLSCFATLRGHGGLFASVNGVAFAADGATLASASDDRTVRLWDAHTGKAVAVLRGHTQAVQTVAFPPDGSTVLVSGGRDRTIQVWDVTERRSIRALTGHQHQVNALAFSPDGRHLASGSADKTVMLWDFATGEVVTTVTGHALAVKAV